MGSAVRGNGDGSTSARELAFSMYQMEAAADPEEHQQQEGEGEVDRLPAAAYTKVDMSMTASSSSSSYYTPQQQQQAAIAGVGSMASVPWGDIGPRPAVEKPYDLSSLLGHDPGVSDAPWRPPPPPISTIATAAVAVAGATGKGSSVLSADAPEFAPVSGSGPEEGVAVAGSVAVAGDGAVEVGQGMENGDAGEAAVSTVAE